MNTVQCMGERRRRAHKCYFRTMVIRVRPSYKCHQVSQILLFSSAQDAKSPQKKSPKQTASIIIFLSCSSPPLQFGDANVRGGDSSFFCEIRVCVFVLISFLLSFLVPLPQLPSPFRWGGGACVCLQSRPTNQLKTNPGLFSPSSISAPPHFLLVSVAAQFLT